MRKLAVLSLLLLLFIANLAVAQEPEDRARFAAEQWIVLVDDGQYDESWKEASKIFQEIITAPEWQKKVENTRSQLGDKHYRKLKDLKTVTGVKGLPVGHYIQVKYESSYAKKKLAYETVTTVQDGDGTWRVVAYAVN